MLPFQKKHLNDDLIQTNFKKYLKIYSYESHPKSQKCQTKYFFFNFQKNTLEHSIRFILTIQASNYILFAQMSLPFALVIPGQPVITNFECTNGIYHFDAPNPKSIANVCFFLTDKIPDNYVLTLYFSPPPYNEMQYLGAIANEKPSDNFSTGFPLKPELDSCNTIKFCIQAQTYDEISNLVRCSDGQQEYAKLVAHNLYNFMMSYHTEGMLINNPQGKEYLVIPSQVFTRWVKKFDQKYQKDPNFILKTTIE